MGMGWKETPPGPVLRHLEPASSALETGPPCGGVTVNHAGPRPGTEPDCSPILLQKNPNFSEHICAEEGLAGLPHSLRDVSGITATSVRSRDRDPTASGRECRRNVIKGSQGRRLREPC